jgi:hypothetical protein
LCGFDEPGLRQLIFLLVRPPDFTFQKKCLPMKPGAVMRTVIVAPFLTLRFLSSENLVLAARAIGLNALGALDPPAAEPFFICTREKPTADSGFAQSGLLEVRVAFLQAPFVQVIVTFAPFVTPWTVSEVTCSGFVLQKSRASPATLGGA